MSDYMFMLESHLGPEQSRVVAEVEAAATEHNVTLFLTGGAMRDMLGGFPIRDLDFTVEGSALKLAQAVAKKSGARIVNTDENRRSAELRFAGGVTAEIAMAREERYTKPGASPQVHPATIHDDLRGRDFTINAIALSLNRSSRGLLLDPNNGLGDLEHKEMRATGTYTFYDDPVRLLRLIRLRARLGFAVEARTQLQYENAREAQVERHIGPRALCRELSLVAEEPVPAEIVESLARERLLALFSPALEGAKLNLQAVSRMQKARQMIPFGVDLQLDSVGLFLLFLTEKLNSREKAALVKNLHMHKAEVAQWQTLEARSRKLEKALKSPKLHRPSQVYQVLREAAGDQAMFLLLRSSQRLVQDRIRNYFQKYLPAAQEVTERELLATGLQPGTEKYKKMKGQMVAARLDARPKKPAPAPEPATVVPAAAPARR